jgi:glycerate-2-kinase
MLIQCNVKNSDSKSPNKLLELIDKGINSTHPAALLKPISRKNGSPDAALFWGKAAFSSYAARPGRMANLVIEARAEAAATRSRRSTNASLVTACEARSDHLIGEHPFPGPGSFRAGRRILEFFDGLERLGVRTLEVHLSGGASSSAWLAPLGVRDRPHRSRAGARRQS